MNEQSYITTKEIAAELRIAKYVVWRLIREGEIPATRVGKEYRILRRDFDEYLKRRSTPKKTNGKAA